MLWSVCGVIIALLIYFLFSATNGIASWMKKQHHWKNLKRKELYCRKYHRVKTTYNSFPAQVFNPECRRQGYTRLFRRTRVKTWHLSIKICTTTMWALVSKWEITWYSWPNNCCKHMASARSDRIATGRGSNITGCIYTSAFGSHHQWADYQLAQICLLNNTEAGKIKLSLKPTENNKLLLQVQDNGKRFNHLENSDGFGTKLISALAAKLWCYGQLS